VEQPITSGQVASLKTALRKATEKNDDEAMCFIVSELVGRNVADLRDLSYSDWAKIFPEAYPDYKNNNWDIGKRFIVKIKAIHRKYLEQIKGQLTLFDE
jgi:hypothetical protein